MKKILYLLITIQILFSIDIYKEIRIDKNEVDNLSFFHSLGIDVDHANINNDYYQFIINNICRHTRYIHFSSF